MDAIAKMLFISGVLLIGVSGIVWISSRYGLPLGHLPGDIHIKRNGVSFFFPVTTCVLLSILISIIVRFFK